MTRPEELIALLKSGGLLGGSFARVQLLNMGESAVRPLLEAVKQEYANSNLRHSAETILVRIGKPAVEALTQSLQDDNPDIRGFAEMVLKYVRGRNYP